MRNTLKRMRVLERQLAGVKRTSAQLRRDGERLAKEIENSRLAPSDPSPRRRSKPTPKS